MEYKYYSIKFIYKVCFINKMDAQGGLKGILVRKTPYFCVLVSSTRSNPL